MPLCLGGHSCRCRLRRGAPALGPAMGVVHGGGGGCGGRGQAQSLPTPIPGQQSRHGGGSEKKRKERDWVHGRRMRGRFGAGGAAEPRGEHAGSRLSRKDLNRTASGSPPGGGWVPSVVSTNPQPAPAASRSAPIGGGGGGPHPQPWGHWTLPAAGEGRRAGGWSGSVSGRRSLSTTNGHGRPGGLWAGERGGWECGRRRKEKADLDS